MNALSELLRQVEASPRDAQLLQKLGDLHRKAGRNDEAAAAFLRVVEVHEADGSLLKASHSRSRCSSSIPG